MRNRLPIAERVYGMGFPHVKTKRGRGVDRLFEGVSVCSQCVAGARRRPGAIPSVHRLIDAKIKYTPMEKLAYSLHRGNYAHISRPIGLMY